MTVYRGTTPDELQRSIDCIIGQTRPPEEFLVVVDGPIPASVEGVLDTAVSRHPTLRVERLPVNLGSGGASARGLDCATGDLLARHDSDDISLPHRLERQVDALVAGGLDLLGAAMTEFVGEPDNIVGIRRNPAPHDQIIRAARLNNPINNPTAIFRREVALRAGGYSDLRYMQDYDLFARMLAIGARAGNLEEPLVLFNAGDGMLARRQGMDMLRREWDLQRRLRASGLIGRGTQARNLVLRGAFRLLPAPVLRTAYGVLFRDRQAAT